MWKNCVHLINKVLNSSMLHICKVKVSFRINYLGTIFKGPLTLNWVHMAKTSIFQMHENRIAASEIISPHMPHIKISSTHQRACICTFKTFSPFWPLLMLVSSTRDGWSFQLKLVGFCWTVDRIRPLLHHIFIHFFIPFRKKNEKNMTRPWFEPTINQSIANSLNHWTMKLLEI